MTWSLKRTVKMSKVLGIAESIIKGLEHGEVTLSKPFSVLEKHMYDSFRANEANSDLDNMRVNLSVYILILRSLQNRNTMQP